MTYEALRQRFLAAGNFHPDEPAPLDEIVKVIGGKDHTGYLMTGFAYELAKYVEETRAQERRSVDVDSVS